MEEVIQYLIRFLIGTPNAVEVSTLIGYTANPKDFAKYKLVIIPSGFFEKNSYGKLDSLPHTPLLEFENCPILFGNPNIERHENYLLLHADIIASSYFLLSRYEEWVRQDARDSHDRFKGIESIAYKGGFYNRPIIEEYGKILREKLRETGVYIEEPTSGISQTYLSHDVDQPLLYQKKRNLIKAAFRSLKNTNLEFLTAFKAYKGNLEQDPAFSFPWIFEQNTNFKAKYKGKSKSILFFKSAIKSCVQDLPTYSMHDSGIQAILKLARMHNVELGLHSSYRSGDEPQLIAMEKERMEKACSQKIYFNRHHYLRAKRVTDMEYLIQAGITDDFTMGYPDLAGFRLGTCKAVQWINPETQKLRPLILHPLTIMEMSLTDKRYMQLTFEEAFKHCQYLINETAKHSGELCLLWHNTELSTKNLEQRELYTKLLNYLIKIAV